MLSYLRTVVGSCKEWIETQRQQQRAYRELMALDDRSLADIGITRANIPYVVFGHPEARCDRKPSKGLPFSSGMGNPVALGKGHRK